MKKLKVLAVILVILSVFQIGAAAVDFVPSIERKDGPDVVEATDELIITPLLHVFDDSYDVHEDIEKSLLDAQESLSERGWSEVIADFEAQWQKYTGGAPIDHAIVSDIFDARLRSELTENAVGGKPISFSIKLQGLTKDDKFMVITDPYGDQHWKTVEYTMGENGLISIDAVSISTFAIVRDNGEDPSVGPDDPDSPQTGVSSYLVPAVVGAVLFSALAVFFAVKLKKSRNA